MFGFLTKLTARPKGAIWRWIPAIALGFALLLPSVVVAQVHSNLLLDVTVNDVKKNLVGNFVRDESGQIGATAKELEEVGVKPPSEGPTDPEAIILLNSLPGVTYKYDETTQTILISAPLDRLAAQKFDVAKPVDDAAQPAIAPQRNWGALANYTLYASGLRDLDKRTNAFSGYSLNLETRAMTPFGTLSQTQIVSGSDFTRQHQKTTRLDTTFTYSDQDSQITYRAGDTVSGGLAWTRPVRMGGAQAQRSFGLRPDLVTLPLPTLTGSAAVPSSVDLYINNLKTYSQDVTAGPFQINNLPSISGSGTARLVVRDATGKEIEQSVPFFVSAKMLKAGLTDFSIEGGFARMNYAQESFSYNRKPIASFSGRHGVLDWLTLEGHAEGSQGFGLAGAGVNVNTFGFGVLSLAGATSWFKNEGVGAQGYGSYDFSIKDITVGISAQRTFKAYNDLASVTAPPIASTTLQTVGLVANVGQLLDLGSVKAPKAIEKLSIGLPIAIDSSSLNFSVARVIDGKGRQSKIASASYSRRLPYNGSFFATAFLDFSGQKNLGLFAGVSFPFGDDISLSSSASRGGNGMQFGAQASKSIKQEEGSYGWRVADLEGGSQTRSASVVYRSGVAQVEGGVVQAGRSAQGAVSVDGSIALAGGDVFLSPRIHDSFAVVDVGAPNVPIEYENRKVATTGSGGRAIVPDLRSFQRNKIAIDPTNLPINASIASTKETIVPADHGVAVVNFGVQASVAGAVVKLVDATGKPLKTGLAGKLADGKEFVVGYDGKAYIEGLSASNAATIDLDPGACQAEFEYKANADEQVVIGPIACR